MQHSRHRKENDDIMGKQETIETTQQARSAEKTYSPSIKSEPTISGKAGATAAVGGHCLRAVPTPPSKARGGRRLGGSRGGHCLRAVPAPPRRRRRTHGGGAATEATSGGHCLRAVPAPPPAKSAAGPPSQCSKVGTKNGYSTNVAVGHKKYTM